MNRKLLLKISVWIFLFATFTAMMGCGKSGSKGSSVSQTDSELLEEVSQRTFKYFWERANPTTGLVLDKYTDSTVASIAATGFGLAAMAVGVERGWITRQQGYDRVLLTLQSFDNGTVEGKNGFFMHWVNWETGKGTWGREVSSIDTALFIAGALFAGEYFGGDVKTLADKLYRNINWEWMTNGGTTLTMGWYENTGFLSSRWGDSFDEGLLATLLAMGSPTHPISAAAWDAINRTITNTYEGETHIALKSESLFVYQFPLIYFDMRDTKDKFGINYFENAIRAAKYNRAYTYIMHSDRYGVYGEVWGLSAEDMPFGGYQAYGACKGNEDGTIAPYASIASLPFTPVESLASLRAMKKNFPKIYGTYGFGAGFNVTTDPKWYSSNYIGIDQGDLLLMIENYRSGLVWEYFMKNQYVQNAMKLAGFDKYQ